MKKRSILILTLFLFACGGGGGASINQTTSEVEIIGLQGDLNAIEPIDLD